MTAPIRDFTEDDASSTTSNGAGNLLGEIAGEIRQRRASAEKRTVDLPVDESPLTVRYRTHVEYELMQKWMADCRDETMINGLNELEVAKRLLATQCSAILRDGDVLTADGQPVVFASAAFQQVIGVGSAGDAVIAVYADDWAVLGAYRQLSAESGRLGNPTTTSAPSEPSSTTGG